MVVMLDVSFCWVMLWLNVDLLVGGLWGRRLGAD